VAEERTRLGELYWRAAPKPVRDGPAGTAPVANNPSAPLGTGHVPSFRAHRSGEGSGFYSTDHAGREEGHTRGAVPAPVEAGTVRAFVGLTGEVRRRGLEPALRPRGRGRKDARSGAVAGLSVASAVAKTGNSVAVAGRQDRIALEPRGGRGAGPIGEVPASVAIPSTCWKGDRLAKSSYSYEKRRKELAKRKKKEDKKQRKKERRERTKEEGQEAAPVDEDRPAE
jgi:hypothetical protein